MVQVSGVTTYVIAWMLQTRSVAPFLIHKVSFSLRKICKLVPAKTKQYRRCLTSHLNRIYNGHALKCRCLRAFFVRSICLRQGPQNAYIITENTTTNAVAFVIIHPQISKGETAKTILVPLALILADE